MRLGLTLPGGSTLDDAVAAERAGIETLYVAEHHFDLQAGYSNAFAVAAALGGVVRHAWIGVRPAIGLEHPLRLVEQSNMLDLLTRGRCLIVLADADDPLQYEAFGLPTPANGLLEDLIQHMDDAWTWEYREDGPPLDFHSGAYESRMAGRIMPAACRKPRPLLAREARTEAEALDAARRGWPVQVRDLRLLHVYRSGLASADLPEPVVSECVERLTVCATVRAPLEIGPLVRQFEPYAVAELRLDPAPGTLIDDVLASL